MQCYLIIVEPWFTPDQWEVGNPRMLTVEQPDLKICRMNVADQDGPISKLKFHYLIGTPQDVSHLTEKHEMALYTPDQMWSFFAEAGLSVQYDPEGIFGRGLYTAREN